ncbi:MAG: hypothetical protein LBE82_10860 [Chitinophagaceae bacterium]|nr:hypothetical protein [Chitinophagaceae bacterium]
MLASEYCSGYGSVVIKYFSAGFLFVGSKRTVARTVSFISAAYIHIRHINITRLTMVITTYQHHNQTKNRCYDKKFFHKSF